MFSKKGGIDLATFVSGIVRALTKGQQALPKARREQIEKHFDKDPETGLYKPKMMVSELCRYQVVNVPSYSLARVNNIGIEAAIIKCSARIVDVDQEEIDCELADHTHQVKYFVKPATPNNKSFEIEIKFSKKQDCEAESKLAEYQDGLVEVQPVPVETSEN